MGKEFIPMLMETNTSVSLGMEISTDKARTSLPIVRYWKVFGRIINFRTCRKVALVVKLKKSHQERLENLKFPFNKNLVINDHAAAKRKSTFNMKSGNDSSAQD